MSPSISKKIERMVLRLSKEMESKKLTGIELSFRSGWKFKLNHSKASRLIGTDNFSYPRGKGFKEEVKA